MRAGEQELLGRTIPVSNPKKVLFPDQELTKADLIDYHRRISEVMLPFVRERPTALKRFPDGIAGQGFFQKDAGEHFPRWLRLQRVPKQEGGHLDHVVVAEAATLVYLADQATIELHPWLSRIDRLDHPDHLMFDLDPPDGDAEAVRRAARRVRQLLAELELDSLVKTSGSAGYHVHVPLDRQDGFDEVRGFARDVARLLSRRHPRELTDAQRKQDRGNRVFLDYLRNAYGQTAIAPYSVRALPGAPVATPLDWDELGRTDPRSYTVGNIFRRLAQRSGPWRAPWSEGQSLSAARDRLDELLRREK